MVKIFKNLMKIEGCKKRFNETKFGIANASPFHKVGVKLHTYYSPQISLYEIILDLLLL